MNLRVSVVCTAVFAALCLAVLGLFRPSGLAEAGDGGAELSPERMFNFRLHDHMGGSHEFREYQPDKAMVLYYHGNGCPIVREHVSYLNGLRDDFEEDGVVFLMINANPQDTRQRIAREAEDFGIDMPILMDRSQVVSHRLEADRTGEAILINMRDWRILYRGAVHDGSDYGASPREPREHYLRDAIEAFLADEPIEPQRTEAMGCLITLRDMPEEVSYAHDIAPIIEQKCLTCHTPGNIGPFVFENYDDVAGWSRMTEEVLMTKRMPPWHADPHYGEFANDRGLTPEEERKLLAWIDAGAPRGDGPDPLAELEIEETPEWVLGEPDYVTDIGDPVEIPAEGVLDYIYRRQDVEIEEDKWVRAVDVQPTDREVTHHVLVFVQYPEEHQHLQDARLRGLDGFFAAYIPGDQPIPFPEGTGKFLPKGSRLVFQLHYTVSGKATTDQTRMALYFHDEEPETEFYTRSAYTTRINIPPHAREHEIRARHRIRQDVLLWEMNPHMHYRGSRFEYTAEFPDGEEEILLSVPDYDFDWQSTYRLKEPIFLPEGTVIRCVGAYDNSPRNPANPDPGQRVRFGEQSFDEMFIGYLGYSPVPPGFDAGELRLRE